jgi:hypothetical protein
MALVRRLLGRVGNQGRALENARLASAELAGRRVEAEEVKLFLAQLSADRAAVSDSRWSDGGRQRRLAP